MTRKLVVIPADRISEWIDKGEVLPRYHNPGNVFDEIHIILAHDESPDPAALQSMAGTAKIFVHAYPAPSGFFTRSAGWNPFLTASWEKGIVPLIRSIDPDIVRCYGAHLNLMLARRIKQELGVPYVVSLHINPDENIHATAKGMKNRAISAFLKRLEIRGLRDANLILPVYESIVPYLRKRKLMQYEVYYNVVHNDPAQIKNDYTLSSPVRVISVGNQMKAKDPSQLIRAVGTRDDIELTLVGKGVYHEKLKSLAQATGKPERFRFIERMDNVALCAALPSYDIMALHTEHFELSKVMIEAMLAGLPLLLNVRETGAPVPELTDDICLRVPNMVQAYNAGLDRLIKNDAFREGLGRAAAHHAHARWSMDKTETAFKNMYLSFLENAKLRHV